MKSLSIWLTSFLCFIIKTTICFCFSKIFKWIIIFFCFFYNFFFFTFFGLGFTYVFIISRSVFYSFFRSFFYNFFFIFKDNIFNRLYIFSCRIPGFRDYISSIFFSMPFENFICTEFFSPISECLSEILKIFLSTIYFS